jgi:hypothetical protein
MPGLPFLFAAALTVLCLYLFVYRTTGKNAVAGTNQAAKG